MTDLRELPPTLIERMASHLRWKLLLLAALPVVFTIGYAGVQRLSPFQPTPMPETAIDRWVGFASWWVWPYLSLYLYLPIAPWLSVRKCSLVRYTLGLVVISTAAFSIFFFLPTSAPREHLLGEVAINRAYELLLAIDLPMNACPSLHAAMVVYSLMVAWVVLSDPIDRKLRRVIVLGGAAWMIAILLGTLGTKQHRALDLFAGSALAVCGYFIAWRSRLPTSLIAASPDNPSPSIEVQT